jgi:hypothetical protein
MPLFQGLLVFFLNIVSFVKGLHPLLWYAALSTNGLHPLLSYCAPSGLGGLFLNIISFAKGLHPLL